MREETVMYRHDEATLQGYLVYDETKAHPLPAVIVAHAWRGQDDFARNKAKKLAELGYVGFAADIYGDRKHVKTSEEAALLMAPFFFDRSLLLRRMKAAYNTVCGIDAVDRQKIGGIGFCFGGLAVIELFRSGVDLSGVVSFHGLLGSELDGKKAKTEPIATGIKGSLLILHGYDDPFVSTKDVLHTEEELTKAEVDWQMHIYGKTAHAFSVPEANDKTHGAVFNPVAEKRSWQAMKNFFTEIFAT